jgi:plasmid stabilization system protein ParE
MKRLVFAPAARTDLLEIGRYIAEDDPIRAEGFLAELETKAPNRRTPGEFSGEGRYQSRPEIGRSWPIFVAVPGAAG